MQQAPTLAGLAPLPISVNVGIFLAMVGQIQIDNDLEALSSVLAGLRAGIVWFDGLPAAGKTTVMKEMADRLGCAAIDVDAFLGPRQGWFVAAIKLDDLAQNIANARARSPVVLVASVCAHDIIDRLRMDVKRHVYIRSRPASGKDWDLTAYETETPPLPLAPEEPGALYREVRHYHFRCKPISRADIIFVLNEPAPALDTALLWDAEA